ncbi:MAG: cytochrome c [Thermoanaerobaculia bacterium]
MTRGRAPRPQPRGDSGSRPAAGIAALAVALTVAGCGAPTSGKSAAELYGEHCTRCHGADGRGDPRALSLSPNSDLTRSRLVRRRARGPIFLRITQGYGSMPGFAHKLERGDVDLLVDYVLELEAP